MGFTWCARVRTGTAESAHALGWDRSRCRENKREHNIEEEIKLKGTVKCT